MSYIVERMFWREPNAWRINRVKPFAGLLQGNEQSWRMAFLTVNDFTAFYTNESNRGLRVGLLATSSICLSWKAQFYYCMGEDVSICLLVEIMSKCCCVGSASSSCPKACFGPLSPSQPTSMLPSVMLCVLQIVVIITVMPYSLVSYERFALRPFIDDGVAVCWYEGQCFGRLLFCFPPGLLPRFRRNVL